MTSGGMACGLLSLVPFAGFAVAAFGSPQWTITSQLVAVPTTQTYTYYYDDEDVYTDTYTDYHPLSPDVTAPASAAISTSTYTDDYDDVEIVMIFLDGEAVDSNDIMTDSDQYDYEDYEDSYYAYTSYLMPLAMTAPSSCPSAFTYNTFTEIYVPSVVVSAGLLTAVSAETSYSIYGRGTTYTYVSSYLSSDAISLTEDITDNSIYSYYVAYCTDPALYFGEYTTTTTTGFDSFPTYLSDGDDDEPSGSSRFGIEDCDSLMSCGWLTTALIVIAAVLPAIFLLGFLESYFWFRRLMTGQSAYRFGTFCWMFLLLPIMCLTRHTPARDEATQASLKEQWKKTSFGTALSLWMKYGFRHKYPAELLGAHPGYDNEFPAAEKQTEIIQQQPIGYGPPPANMPSGPPPMVYYLPTGTGTGGAGPTQAPPMQPPSGGAPYYPQYPPQTFYAAGGPPPPHRARHSRPRGYPRGAPISTVSSPSPVSEVAEPVTSDDPARPDVSPPVSPPTSPPTVPSEPVTRPPPPPTQTEEAGPSGQTRD